MRVPIKLALRSVQHTWNHCTFDDENKRRKECLALRIF